MSQPANAYPPLEAVTRPAVDTATAAYYLNRAQQTLRIWACKENGPVRPVRVNGKLLWPVAELRRLVHEGDGKPRMRRIGTLNPTGAR